MNVHCNCGLADNDAACAWHGPRSQTVVVEWMPREHRESHEAAGNAGTYPHNGAVRLRCERSCAARLVADSPGWAEVES